MVKSFKTGYLVGVHPASFRPGEKSEILGVVLVDVDTQAIIEYERPCFLVRYEDTTTDFVPLASVEDGTYTIVSKNGPT